MTDPKATITKIAKRTRRVYNALQPPPQVKIDLGGESKTQQQFKEQVDINYIVQKYGIQDAKTGIRGSQRTPIYGDFSNIPDYSNALQAIIKADNSFADLPAKTRAFFDNDPGKLISFLDNPQNTEKAIEIGLIPKPKPNQTPAQEVAQQPEKPKNPDPEPEKAK